MDKRRRAADGKRVVLDPKELSMRLYAQTTRLAILAGLVVAAALCGGWKWEGLAF
jgi:hypothetical protein